MSTLGYSRVFTTLLDEGTLAAELLCAGVTTLRTATTPKRGLYELALFNLSIGLERVCKLAVLIDYYISNNSRFPTNELLKNSYGHDLDKLFPAVAKVVADRKITADYTERPQSEIHDAIISTLAQFAKTTRYYNLDSLTGGKAARLQSGSAAWVGGVGRLILKKHYSPRKQIKDVLEAQELQASMGHIVSGIRFDEAGNSIDSLEQGLIHGAEVRVIQKFGQFYCLQLIRYLAAVLEELRSIAHCDGFQDIPFFGEVFAWFINDDAMLKSRKTWRIPQ
jgi:hypothetical protein